MTKPKERTLPEAERALAAHRRVLSSQQRDLADQLEAIKKVRYRIRHADRFNFPAAWLRNQKTRLVQLDAAMSLSEKAVEVTAKHLAAASAEVRKLGGDPDDVA